MKRKKLKARYRGSSKQSSESGAGASTGSGAAPAGDSGRPSYTAADLLDHAEALLEDEAEVDAAQRFCLRALELEPTNARAYHLCGLLLLESGEDQREEAQYCFQKTLEYGVAESTKHSVHLYLGQLLKGAESLDNYQKGIELMRSQLASVADTEQGAVGGEGEKQVATGWSRWREEPVTWRLVSNAYCAVAELFMTDLCDEKDAEQQCRSAIESAREADPSNPEPHHMLAALHLVKQEPELARTAINQCLELWQPALRAALHQGGSLEEEEDEEEMEGKASERKQQPVDITEATGMSFDARFKCSQTLVELGMLKDAVEVLESCHMENDEDLQVTYLFAVAYFQLWERGGKGKKGEGQEAMDEDEDEVCENAENARTLLRTAFELAQKTRECNVMEDVQEMMAELGGFEQGEEDLADNVPESSDEDEKMEDNPN